MNAMMIALIAFTCIFGGVLLGSFFRTFLPEHHLRDDSKDTVKLGAGLIATLVALVLGLLVSSAKNSFDAVNTLLTKSSAQIILLDHVLAQYGTETMEARSVLRQSVASAIEYIWPSGETGVEKLHDFEGVTGAENVQGRLRQLSPQDNSQRLLLSQAMELSSELAQTHWLLIEETQSVLPTPFIMVLVFWLFILFVSFGLLAPRNATVFAVLFVCAWSVSSAIFLILEMNRPLDGMIKVSGAALRKAFEHLGQ